MAPHWLQIGGEQSKRASLLSVVSSTTRRTVHEDSESVAATFAHPFFDNTSLHDDLDGEHRDSVIDRTPSSRKRYSLFARSVATSDADSERTVETTKHWSRLGFQDKSHLTVRHLDDADRGRDGSRDSPASRTTSRAPILRWMRRGDRYSSTRPAIQFDREQKKNAISAPFNFQHITHTQRRELPQLDQVSDRDLTLTFWASSAHQVPQGDLRGIQADEIGQVQRMSRTSTTTRHTRPISRPVSSSDSINFSRVRSPSLARETSPRLRASRSLSNSSTGSNEEFRGAPTISRSASLASLIAEQRSPPAAVHPAFRDAVNVPALPQPPAPWAAPSGRCTPSNESIRNLDSVPEEMEGQSPRRSSTLNRLDRPSVVFRPTGPYGAHSGGSHLSTSTIDSDGQGTAPGSQCDTSIPSLSSGESSGETWEEDVEFAYKMEAESTCNFSYATRTLGLSTEDPLLAAVSKPRHGHRGPDMSPRESIALHQRGVSPITTKAATSNSSDNSAPHTAWDFERAQGDGALPEIKRLSSLLDMPMLQLDLSGQRAGSPSKSSDQTITDFRSSQVLQPSPPLTPRSWTTSFKSLDSSKTPPTPSSRRISAPQAPSPPPCVPLPPIPCSREKIMAAKRATLATAPGPSSGIIVMRRPETTEDRSLLQAAGRNVQHYRSTTPVRLHHSRSVEAPALRELMKRSMSSPSVNELYKAHALPKTAEKFPAWNL